MFDPGAPTWPNLLGFLAPCLTSRTIPCEEALRSLYAHIPLPNLAEVSSCCQDLSKGWQSSVCSGYLVAS